MGAQGACFQFAHHGAQVRLQGASDGFCSCKCLQERVHYNDHANFRRSMLYVRQYKFVHAPIIAVIADFQVRFRD